ncbi:MAG: glycerophosphodiester phosphodiesterase [Deltaproteobacteria bacterium]|nr:glycerophosphodiester phosphodiesterase [Deltaproteobacteria bacterium]
MSDAVAPGRDLLARGVRRALGTPWLRALDPLLLGATLGAARPTGQARARLDGFYRREGGPRPLVLGHRGASARAPENTLGAFRAALDDGGDGVELDVQLTADAVPVVLHDDTLDRTTTLKGSPVRHEAAELDLADAGTWFRGWGREKVPRLAEVLGALPAHAVVNVELKGPTPRVLGLERRVVEVLRDFPDADVLVSSFHPAQLLELRALAPDVPLALLWHEASLLPLRTGWAAPFVCPEAVHPQSGLVDGELVAAAHRSGMRVHVWGVKDDADAERLLTLGVDGLIVDDVRATRAVLARRLGLLR